MIKNYSGFNLMWIVENSMEVHKVMKRARNMVTYDFSTLYTSIPHKKLKQEMSWVINKAFSGMNKKLIRFTKSSAYWSNTKEENFFSVDCKTLIRMVDWLIDNTFVVVGEGFSTKNRNSYGYRLCSVFSKFVFVCIRI